VRTSGALYPSLLTSGARGCRALSLSGDARHIRLQVRREG
jgi:hypothetical protein